MPDPYVFISHKSEDKPRIRPMVEAFLQRGLRVWIDNPEHFSPPLSAANLLRLRSGEDFRKGIAERIADSGCVLVFWSERSIKSTIVCDEASRALRQDKLVPVLIDLVELPIGFGGLKTSNLAEVLHQPAGSDGFESVVGDIAHLLGRQRVMAEQSAPAAAIRVDIAPDQAFRNPRVDRSLTYLLDRDRQVVEFSTCISREVRDRERNQVPRAGIVLLSAPREERPDVFLDSVCHRSRAAVRDLIGHEFDLVRKPFAWPECGTLLRRENAVRHLNACVSKVGAALNIPEGMIEYDPAAFQERLIAGLRAVGRVPERSAAVLTTQIYPDRWTDDDERLLRDLIDWWQSVEFDSSIALPVLVIAVVQPVAAKRRIGWFRKAPEVGAFFDRLAAQSNPRLALLKLSPLDSISEQHANNWLDHILPQHLDVLDRDLETIRQAIATRFAQQGTQPLEDVARWLQDLLDQTNLNAEAFAASRQRYD